MKRIPSLVGLQTFDAVARHSSFSKAGRELHVTQSAVSHRIRGLEDELGVELFVRSSRQVEMSPAGKVLFRATRDAFRRLNLGLREMESVSSPDRVTVSCSPSFAIRWLVPHLGDLREAAPEIDIHISADDQLVEPGAGTIDVCVRYGAGGYDGVDYTQLTQDVITPVCSPLYRRERGLSSPEQLRDCVLLHDDVLADHASYIGWREWSQQAGVDVDPERGAHYSHSHLALESAIAGQGIALARTTLIRRALADSRLVRPFDLRLESGLNYWLVMPRNTPQTSAAKTFEAWLKAALLFESMGDSGS